MKSTRIDEKAIDRARTALDQVEDDLFGVRTGVTAGEWKNGDAKKGNRDHGKAWWIEGSDRVTRLHEDIHLIVTASDPAGRILWRGILARRVDKESGPRLEEAVAALLQRFPPGS